ncbi:putative integral membrane protein [Theileria parva strain Muguga]|uniref:Uncharacterized protein n=1 Tax=Theileria parva TaxID=5875 RepID=Q4N7M7_THEPA|nr:putative integral membrane protein [Theileria parva strain Muguga]EAN34031.1 putative integral membrane protein [Theileria parva strain Muguga]|eukprot:XP_766314.1 hypothetical protein [Theileria parva strain Muguga]
MAQTPPFKLGIYGHVEHVLLKFKSTVQIKNIHEGLISFYQKLLVYDPNSFYILLTSSFALMFILIFAYYRLMELSKSYQSIIRRKIEFQEISKDRIKSYMLNVLEDYFI